MQACVLDNSPGAQIIQARQEEPARRYFEITLDRKAVLSYPPLGMAQTVPVVAPGARFPLRMRTLMAQAGTTGGAILYARQTSWTDATAAVTAGAVKPSSDAAYDVVMAPVITVASYMKIAAQYWDDFEILQNWINGNLFYNLSVAEEYQFLNGDNTPPNAQGFLQVVPVTATVGGTGGATLLANVAAGIADVYGRGYLVTGIVLNPHDWGVLLSSAVAYYLLGTSSHLPTEISLWGIPLVLSPAMPTGNYLVGQFDPYSQIFDREDAAVEAARQNEDDFIHNLVAIRSEERLAFAVYQPNAFAQGTFTL